MQKRQQNTELIAFRVTKNLKRRFEELCVKNGMGIADQLRCLMASASGELEEGPESKEDEQK